jgi:tyrosyl-DNA phosphodiesterase-1
MLLGTLRRASAQDDDTKNEKKSEGESNVESVDTAGSPLRRPHAWFYVGSHNFSVGAWGALTGTGFNPVLNVRAFAAATSSPCFTPLSLIPSSCSPSALSSFGWVLIPHIQVVNYELGIVLRLERPEDVDAAVAWKRPTQKYAEGDVPWVSTLSSSFFISALSLVYRFLSTYSRSPLPFTRDVQAQC